MGAVGSGPFAGNDVNRRRNLVTGYTKYNTYTPITQLNQLNYDAQCSLETSIKLTRVTRGFEPRYRGSARAGQTTEPSAGRKPAARAKRQNMNVSNHERARDHTTVKKSGSIYVSHGPRLMLANRRLR